MIIDKNTNISKLSRGQPQELSGNSNGRCSILGGYFKDSATLYLRIMEHNLKNAQVIAEEYAQS